MKNLELKKLEKETEKAINVTVVYNDSEVTIWLPKSSANIVDNFVEVKEKFWMHKEIEIINNQRNKGSVRLIGSIKEFDKSFGINVNIYECISEQSIHRMMFFPKSQVTEVADNSFVVPAWLFYKKEEELKEDNQTNSFHASTFEVEVEKQFINQ
jgi:hypothetical protein